MKSKFAINAKSLGAAAMAAVLATAGINFGITASAEARQPEFGNYFTSDYDSIEEAFEDGIELNKEIYSEGVTLLKNEDNCLPLNSGAKVTLLGKNSNSLSEFGGASGSMQGIETPIQLVEALEGEGFEVNPTLVNFYADNSKSGEGRGNSENGKGFPSNGNIISGYNTGETPISSYTQDITNSLSQYNDAAIVVFLRVGGEGTDLARTMTWNGSSYKSWGTSQLVPGARSADDHYLQLDKNETDLLKYANDHFDKVIVLLNMGTTFECGFLDDPGHYAYQPNIKGALNIGFPGKTGLPSLAKILKGEINPSGKTIDTWARDFTKDPTWANFGNYRQADGNKYSNANANYITYSEGIYVGYRYWETRGYDEGLNQPYNAGSAIKGTATSQWSDWYNAHVVYPLGYGLSYTTFSQQIVSSQPEANSSLTANGKITVEVKVTNTGTVAGKDVAELYYTPPFFENGIEKAHNLLCGFEKTDLLQPGESQILEIGFDVRDMASYDYSDANGNDFCGYELDAGNYAVKLMRNAHEEIATVNYKIDDNIKYETSETTGYEIANRFDDVSNYITEDLGEKYLSRSDWEGTFPQPHIKISAAQWVVNELEKWAGSNRPASETDEPWYTTEMPVQGADGTLKLQDLVGVEYNDTLWDEYLNRFTVKQLTDLTMQGNYYSGQEYPELGVTRVHNNDDPNGIHEGESLNGWKGWYISFVNEAILSSSWNRNLSYEKGKNIGNQALWGVGRGNVPGWYAPATNTHRSPFGGRNFEYYSEDGFLAGVMASSQVSGAQEKGMFCYVKHFAVNDQETNRTGLCTWLNEQSMREIYFKSFEMCVKDGGALGTMSALNRIGATWAGGCYGLLTEVLKKEWGFCGAVVTDSYMSHMGGADLMIRAGGNLALGSGSLSYNVNSATTVACLREAAHGILYMHANSMAMNRGEKPVAPDRIKTFTGGTIATAVLGTQYTASIASAKVDKENYPDITDEQIVYSVAAGSTLPKGLMLSENGTISGIPEEKLNSYKFKIAAKCDNTVKIAEFVISVIGAGGAIVYEADENLASARVGVNYSADIASAVLVKPGGDSESDGITYALESSSYLPEGLTLSADGKITGKPLKYCENYKFTVLASAEEFEPVAVTFTLSVYTEMVFGQGTLAVGKYGVSYVSRIQPAQSENAVVYELKSGSSLPRGLTLTQGGYITGTPLECVTDHKFTVVAKSAFTEPQEAEYSLTIGLTYNDVELPEGTKGEEYSARVDTAQGAGTVNYSIKEGTDALPEGLMLSADGIISGTPEKAGVYTLTITAEADGKAGDEIVLTLYIANSSASSGGCNGTVQNTLTAALVPLTFAGAVYFLLRRRSAKTRN